MFALHDRLTAIRLAAFARRAAAGDGRAFRRLFEALHPAVYGYLAARLASVADAEDLTAAAFTRVVERLSTYDASRGGPRAWVLAIARNLLIDHLRARKDHAPLSEVEAVLADARLSPDVGGDERLERVRQALLRYPQATREMFALRFGEGLDNREIAVVMNMSHAAVKQRFSRVLRELRRRAEGGETDQGESDKEVAHAH